MATERIDIVVSSNTRRVVRDLNEIGNAADHAHRKVQNLQAQLNRLNSSNFSRQLNNAQRAVSGLGTGHQLQQFQQAIAQATAQLQQLNQQLNNVANTSRQMGNTVGASLRQLIGPLSAIAGYLSVRQILEWADHWIAASGKIRVFADSQLQANAIIEEVFNIAQKVRQPLESMANLYTRLAIAGSELGISQQEMLRFTENVGKILAIQGTSALQARGALLQLAQAMGEGVVRAQEFNSLIENAPYLLKIAAQNIEGAGGSVAKLRSLMLDGKLKSREFFDAIMKGSKDIDAAFGNTRKTFAQSFIVLENAVTRFLGKLDEATGASDKFYRMAQFISNNIDDIAKGILVIGSAIAVAFAPTLLLRFAGALGVVAGALRAVTAVLLTNPFVLLAAAATYAALFADKILIGVDHMTTLQDVFTVLKPIASGVWQDIVNGASSFGTQIMSSLNTMTVFGRNLGEEISKWWQWFASFFDGIEGGLAGVIQGTARVFDRMGAIIRASAFAVVNAFGALPGVIDQVGVDMRNAMRTRIEELVNNVVTGINKLRGMIGKDPLGFIQLQREAGVSTAYKDYGAQVASAFKEGFDSQGGALERGVVKVIEGAKKVAHARVFKELRDGERNAVNLNNPNPSVGAVQGTDAKAAKKAAAEAQRAAKQAVQDSQDEIRNLLAAYRENAVEMTEVERHRQAMLKVQYDQGLLNYQQYSTSLEALQDEMHMRQRQELSQQQVLMAEKMTELRNKMKRAGVGDKEIKNTLDALEIRLAGLNTQLVKLDNSRTERIGNALAEAIKPARELAENAERELAAVDNNYEQRVRQLQAVNNIASLSEREQFILTGTNQVLNQYEDKLTQIEAIRARMIKDGVFDDINDPAVAKAFNDINKFIDLYRQRIQQIKQEAPGILGQAFDSQQQQALAQDLSRSLLSGILDAGREGSGKLRRFITDELMKKPFRISLEAALKPVVSGLAQSLASVLQPFIGSLSGIFDGILNGRSAASSAGGGILGGLVNGAGMLGGMFGAGGLTGALSAGAGWLTGSTTLMGSLGAAGSLIGTGGAGITAGLAMGAGAVLPIAAAAYGLYSLFGGGKGGGPKAEGFWGTLSGGASSSQDLSLMPMISKFGTDMQRSFQNLVRAFGGTDRGVQFGLLASTDPRGDSESIIQTNASIGGNTIFDWRQTNVGRGDEEVQKAIQTQMVAALVHSLRWSNIDKAFLDYFSGIKDMLDPSEQIQELQRLAGFANVINNMRVLGSAFDNFVIQSFDVQKAIADLSGGFEAFTQNVSVYTQNFFSESERKQMQAAEISRTLQAAGLQYTTAQIATMSRANFRNVVEGLDLSTDAGQRMYAAMMQVAGSFAAITESAESAINIHELYSQRVGEAKDVVKQAYEREKQLAMDRKRTAEDLLKDLNSFKTGLTGSQFDSRTPVQQYASARAELFSRMQTGGTIPEGFTEMAKNVLELSRTVNASGGQFQSDFDTIQAWLNQGIKDAQAQVTKADQQLQKLDNAVSGIFKVNESVMGVYTAVQQLRSVMQQVTANQMNANSVINPQTYGIRVTMDSDLVRALEQLRSQGHAGGIENVPYNDYYFRAHRGEAVLNATDAAVWRGMQGNATVDVSGLMACINALREEVAEMREQQVEATKAEIVANREALAQNAQAITTGIAASMAREQWKSKQASDAKYE